MLLQNISCSCKACTEWLQAKWAAQPDADRSADQGQEGGHHEHAAGKPHLLPHPADVLASSSSLLWAGASHLQGLLPKAQAELRTSAVGLRIQNARTNGSFSSARSVVHACLGRELVLHA